MADKLTQRTTAALRGYFDGLDKARTADRRFAPEHQTTQRQKQVAQHQAASVAALQALSERARSAADIAQHKIEQADKRTGAADLMRRQQVWERTQRLLDASPDPGQALQQLLDNPADFLPTDSPETVLRAAYENAPAWATVNPGATMPTAAEVGKYVHQRLADIPGEDTEYFRELDDAQTAEELAGAAEQIVTSFETGKDAPAEAMSTLQDVDQELFKAVISTSLGLPGSLVSVGPEGAEA